MTTDLSNRRDKLIVAIHAQLLLKGEDPAEPELFFLLPLQNKVKKKIKIMHSVNVNVHSVIPSAVLALLHFKPCISSTPVVWVV